MFKITLKLSKSPLLLSYFMQFNIFKYEVSQERPNSPPWVILQHPHVSCFFNILYLCTVNVRDGHLPVAFEHTNAMKVTAYEVVHVPL